MSVIFIALGILVALVLAVIVPWALLRALERDDQEKEDG
jgi:hydrogenase-4 membrane subunit HyfE